MLTSNCPECQKVVKTLNFYLYKQKMTQRTRKSKKKVVGSYFNCATHSHILNS